MAFEILSPETPPGLKNRLRNEMKRRLAALAPGSRHLAAIRACSVLTGLPAWRNARSILLYLAFGDELDTAPVVEAAFADGKYVYAPRIRDELMDFIALASADGPFEVGTHGIRTPIGTGRAWNALASPGPALILVPGLAFDAGGTRLGRGGGYYDRFLGTLRLECRTTGEKPPFCLGYGYSVQEIDEVPSDPHDESLDGLVTDAGARLSP